MAPGVPGVQWTDEQTLIIRNKIRTIWADPYKYYDDLSSDEVYKEDEFDVEHICKAGDTFDGCKGFVAGSEGQKIRLQLAFTPRKALRLAFHDCFKYKEGGMGCDGCMNFDENLDGNNGLQHTAAILVSTNDFVDLVAFLQDSCCRKNSTLTRIILRCFQEWLTWKGHL